MPASGEPRHRRTIRHGLTSRTPREDHLPEVEALAKVLRGCSPPEPRILKAAQEAAEAILHHHRVKTIRLAVLNELMIPPSAMAPRLSAGAMRAMMAITSRGITASTQRLVERYADVLGLGIPAPPPAPPETEEEATERLLAIYRDYPSALRRFDEYERKALSRRQDLLRRLDFERIEAERRRAASQMRERRVSTGQN